MENPATENWQPVLRHEFDGEENSFLLDLRCGSDWDWSKFSSLFYAMRECCKAHEGIESVERWIAEGFWYLSWFPKSNLEHTGNSVVEPYLCALVNLDHLAFWLFTGASRRDDEFEPMPLAVVMSHNTK